MFPRGRRLTGSSRPRANKTKHLKQQKSIYYKTLLYCFLHVYSAHLCTTAHGSSLMRASQSFFTLSFIRHSHSYHSIYYIFFCFSACTLILVISFSQRTRAFPTRLLLLRRDVPENIFLSWRPTPFELGCWCMCERVFFLFLFPSVEFKSTFSPITKFRLYLYQGMFCTYDGMA